MSQKKAGGKSKNGRDSNPKNLGFKIYCNQLVFPGNIILKQKGTKFHPGINVGIGKDYTLFSKSIGNLFIKKKKNKKFLNVV